MPKPPAPRIRHRLGRTPAAWTAIGALALLAVSALAVGVPTHGVRTGPASLPAAAANWTQLNTSLRHPPEIYGGSAVYDPSDHYVVLVGGNKIVSGASVPNNDTWKFVGGAWTKLHPTHAPPAGARGFSPTLTYDAADGYVVWFGNGCWAYRNCNQTWTFHAGQWTNVTTATAPPASFWASMTYDAKDGYVFLVVDSGFAVTEWKFLHGTWAPLTVTNPPKLGAWADFQAVYDPHDGYVLFASAFNQTCTVGRTTVYYCMHSWSYVGGTFTPLANASKITTTRFSITYDSMRGEAVLFGGTGLSGPFTGTFAFRGGLWHPVVTAASPPTRSVAAMAFDAHDRYLLLFGGEDSFGSSGPVYYDDSWVLR